MTRFFLYLALFVFLFSPAAFANYELEIQTIKASSETEDQKVKKILEIIKKPDCDNPFFGFQEIFKLLPPNSPLLEEAFTDQDIPYETRARCLIQILSSASLPDVIRYQNTDLWDTVIKENPQSFYSSKALKDTSLKFFGDLIYPIDFPVEMFSSIPKGYILLSPHEKLFLYTSLLKMDFNLEKSLHILERMSSCGHYIKGVSPQEIKVIILNEFLRLNEKYGDSKASTTNPIVSEDDLLRQFEKKELIRIIPDVLMDKSLDANLWLKMSLAEFYLRRKELELYRDDKTEDCTPSLIQLFKEVATSEDGQLDDSDRFKACRYLSRYSEPDAAPIIIDVLGREVKSLSLPHVQLARVSSDPALREKGEAVLEAHQSIIRKKAQERYDRLPLPSRLGLSEVSKKTPLQEEVTVVVLDGGFSKVVPGDICSLGPVLRSIYRGHADEKTLQWDLLHKEKMRPLRTFEKSGCTFEDLSLSHCHGSIMVDIIATLNQGAHILPIISDVESESWVAALDAIADDPTIKIINISQGLPSARNYLEDTTVCPEVKKSMLKCLNKDKIIVLGAGNEGTPITKEPIASNGFKVFTAYDMNKFGRRYSAPRIYSLFEGEPNTSRLFSHFIIAGSSKAGSLEIHEKSNTPGEGPAQRCYVYVDADKLTDFFDELPEWGGTSSATAIISGIASGLWNRTEPDPQKAAKIVKAIFESTDIAEGTELRVRGRGKVNLSKAIKRMEELSDGL